MKNIVALGFFIFATTLFADLYICKEHTNQLKIKEVGFEHINHKVYLNDKTLAKELYDGRWFIEKVTCIKNGFKLTTSHIQYNYPKQRTFLLYILDNGDYELK